MGLPVGATYRLRTRYVPHDLRVPGISRAWEKHRRDRIRSYQQRGRRVEHDIHDGPSQRVVLQRHRRLVPQRRMHRDRVRLVSESAPPATNLFINFDSSFPISTAGLLDVTIGPRQAIAVHTGAMGSGTSTPKTAEFVPVLFNVNASVALTAPGEVGPIPRVPFLITDWFCCDSVFSSWAMCPGSETGIPTKRYVFPYGLVERLFFLVAEQTP